LGFDLTHHMSRKVVQSAVLPGSTRHGWGERDAAR
jgi:hypothetical protein